MQSDSKQKKPVSPLHWAREQSLNKREFGTDGLAVPALNAWLQAQHWPNGADLFPDSPAFIQIELFLCRIEYARFADMTEAAAVALVPVSVLEKYAADIGSPLEEVQQMGMGRWLAGASVHLIMRENIRAALEGGDLQRVDAWTLGPKAAPTGSTRTATPDTALATTGEQTATAGPLTAPDKPAPAAIVGITEAVRPLTTAQVADAFDGELELSAAQWRERLGDMPLWLLPARAAKGKAPNPSTWWPLEFARILLERGATFDSLNRKFLAVPALKPWLPAWQEQRRERNAFGQ